MVRVTSNSRVKRPGYRIADRLASTTLAQALCDALTGAANVRAPDVVWEDRGSQLLLHVGRLQVRTLDNLLVVAVDVETAEFGATPLIVRFVFGGKDDPATLVASSDEAVHGHPLVAARWGPLFRGVIWSAIVRLSEAHADERGLRPTSIRISGSQLRFAAKPTESIQQLAAKHLKRPATKPAKPRTTARTKIKRPKPRRPR